MEISKQLQNPEFRFVLIPKGSKKPCEKEWTTKNNYNYNDPKLLSWIASGGNHGILTGIGGLMGLDDDSQENILTKLAELELPNTRKHKSGSGKGGHLLYIIEGSNQKIILYENPDDKDNRKHLGELQGKGQQIVCPGSVHPSGGVYSVDQDIEIAAIPRQLFEDVFKNYIPTSRVIEPRTPSQIDNIKYEGGGIYESVSDIPITNIISADQDECIQDGAETPPNFKVYSHYFRCFHHHSWGDVWAAIAVKHGIINCADAKNKCLTIEDSKRVIEIAQGQYGLKKVKQNTNLGDPRGWALSLSITKIAKDHQLLNCPKCKSSFKFTESHGFFECETCKYRGGLKKFAILCLEKEKLT